MPPIHSSTAIPSGPPATRPGPGECGAGDVAHLPACFAAPAGRRRPERTPPHDSDVWEDTLQGARAAFEGLRDNKYDGVARARWQRSIATVADGLKAAPDLPTFQERLASVYRSAREEGRFALLEGVEQAPHRLYQLLDWRSEEAVEFFVWAQSEKISFRSPPSSKQLDFLFDTDPFPRAVQLLSDFRAGNEAGRALHKRAFEIITRTLDSPSLSVPERLAGFEAYAARAEVLGWKDLPAEFWPALERLCSEVGSAPSDRARLASLCERALPSRFPIPPEQVRRIFETASPATDFRTALRLLDLSRSRDKQQSPTAVAAAQWAAACVEKLDDPGLVLRGAQELLASQRSHPPAFASEHQKAVTQVVKAELEPAIFRRLAALSGLTEGEVRRQVEQFPAEGVSLGRTTAKWAEQVRAGLETGTTGIGAAQRRIFETAFAQARAAADPADGARLLVSRLPPGLERSLELEALFAGRPIPADVLDLAQDSREPQLLATRLVTHALSWFPAAPQGLFDFLRGGPVEAVSPGGSGPQEVVALLGLRAVLDELAPAVREEVLGIALRSGIEHASELYRKYRAQAEQRGMADPRETVRVEVRRRLMEPLRDDPDAALFAERVATVFEALPEHVQARVLASLVSAPTDAEAPELLRRFLVAGGVVAVKVGQQLSEDPKVPPRFQRTLAELKGRNEPLRVAEIWPTLPESIRSRIAGVHGTLGTGSVKQTLDVETHDGERLTLAVIRPGVREEIRQTLDSLRTLPEWAHLVDRVESMLLRELDLRVEAEAFERLRGSAVGSDPSTFVPRVVAATPTALLRTHAEGATFGALLQQRALSTEEKGRLERTHRLLIESALVPDATGKTYILTDPHLDNLSDDGSRVGLFDPGQYEELSGAEARAFSRLLLALARPEIQSVGAVERTVVEGLAPLCTLAQPDDGGPALVDRLRAAYDDSLSDRSAHAGRKLGILLESAHGRGVAVPDGFYGLAKMLHSVFSQELELGLVPVAPRTIRDLCLSDLGSGGQMARKVAQLGDRHDLWSRFGSVAKRLGAQSTQ